MKNHNAPHILFVNPWIHDFAAFDFWARPLGLLQLASITQMHGMTVSYVDCLNRFHPHAQKFPQKHFSYGRGAYLKTEIPKPEALAHFPRKYSRYGILPEWLIQDLKSIDKPDIIMVTSLMTYWYPGVQETIAIIRSIFKDVPIILGGIYVRLCLSHARHHMDADYILPDLGENCLLPIISEITGYDPVPNFDPNQLDTLPYPAWNLQQHIPFVPLLTTRGCPFRCEYCASGFLEKRLRRRSVDHVVAEIKYWHQQYNIQDFVFYDDALLFQSETFAKPLLTKIVNQNLSIRFHTPNAIHIREISQTIAQLFYAAGFKNLRLGLETMDFNNRMDQKLTYEEFETAIKHLKDAGFNRQDMGAYLLIGLPGQSSETIIASIDCVKKCGIQPILAYYTPIPHTQLWQKAVEHSPFDIALDPLFANNTLFPCQADGLKWRELSTFQKRAKSWKTDYVHIHN